MKRTAAILLCALVAGCNEDPDLSQLDEHNPGATPMEHTAGIPGTKHTPGTQSNHDWKAEYKSRVAPLLQAHCAECHSGDDAENGVRLGALTPLLSSDVVTPGDPGGSLLMQMISGDEPTMPPEEPLEVASIDAIRQWITRLPADAIPRPPEARSHWAWREFSKQAIPSVRSEWPRNDIDRFVLHRMSEAGLKPSSEASIETLARRLSLDLVGLPPSVSDVDRLVREAEQDRNKALQRYTRQLINSRHFGEHWGRYWLDLARYADSNGYHRDQERPMWLYREWVIDAFNDNMPFDQFTIRQLAGDLLPGTTRRDKIATGFHRNSMFNQEGGADEQEFRTHAVADRAETTATVWLGLTLRCARCHNHPIEPVTQREYYRYFAFFNNTTDRGTSRYNPPFPVSVWPSKVEQRELADLRARIDQRTDELNAAGVTAHTADDKVMELRRQFNQMLLDVPSSLTMKERDEPRETMLLLRGDPSRPGPRVTANVPRIFPHWPENRPRNRLGLAEWLVTDAAHITARVTVNRVWRRLFGAALARGPENLGLQSDSPSHPQLLDWLATEFINSKWNVKHLIELMVSSATWRQSSVVTTNQLTTDPENRFLSRAARFRLDAEVIRDNALVVSGLLNRRVGGRSVFPPQPEGLWDEIEGNEESSLVWRESTGPDRYRRSMYTFWRRSMPYPLFTVFDAPQREECTVTRSRTNTPLQALAAQNDPVLVEAAELLAERIVSESPDSTEAQIAYGFRLCLARLPTPEESTVLLELWNEEFAAAMEQLLGSLAAGASADDVRGPATAQAWRVTAGVLFNLDATLTRW